jgi:pimeloyl-ACP methyl ester carboxylesterase
MPLPRIADHARWIVRLVKDNLREVPDRPSAGGAYADETPIVLLHGFGGTPRMLRPLGRFLRRDLGRPTLDLPLGAGFGDIRDSAMSVHRHLVEHGVTRYDVVGYSMGGLVATYLLKCLDHGRSIRQVITLATPHRGVPLVSSWPNAVARLCRSAGQMKFGSPFLAQLGRVPLPDGIRMLSIAGECDVLVPPESARLDEHGCRKAIAPGIGHAEMLLSRRVFRRNARALRGPPRSRASAGPSPIVVPVGPEDLVTIPQRM